MTAAILAGTIPTLSETETTQGASMHSSHQSLFGGTSRRSEEFIQSRHRAVGNPSVPVRLGLLWCFEVEPFFFAGGAFIPQLECHPCRAIALAVWLCRPRPFLPLPSS